MDAVFPKEPGRIEDLDYVMLQALLVLGAIERGAAVAGVPPDPLRGPPDGRRVRALCRCAAAVPEGYRPTLRVILEALEFSDTIYTTVPAPAASL